MRRARQLPPGDEILQSAEGRRGGPTAYVVKKHIMVGGDTLVDAQASFQDNEPVVSFSFDIGGRETIRRRDARQCREAFRDRARQQGDQRAGDPRGDPWRQRHHLGQFHRPIGERSGATAARGRAAGPDHHPRGAHASAPISAPNSIHAGAVASVVGVVLVVIFMFLFYGLFGLFADIALFFNLCLMLGALSLFGATLTLPGIAGIALTMGMAVDANVLIYERIREEMRGGRTMLSSLEAGFTRAFGTILDSHVTTLVAGILLYWLGSGPVKGFAVTLSIGVLTSLFSAILVTRLQIVTWVRRLKPKAIPL